MGGQQSKKGNNGNSLSEVVQQIAAEYITTPSFTDMQKLSDPAYCNNLVLLTTSILDKHLTNKDVVYLSDQIKTKDSFLFAKKKDFNKIANDMDSKKKNEVCRGIAKFYIKIAHLFAAIKGTINTGSLCNRRIDSLKNNQDFDKNEVIVNPNYCNMNKKIPSKPGQVIGPMTLDYEKGIPELEKIYYDVYNYDLGEFTSMSKKSNEEYKQHLKQFYQIFTGSSNMPNTIKKFSDIHLHDYHRSTGCNARTGEYVKQYVGTKQQKLFKQYADHVNQMLNTTSVNQNKLLAIINVLFTQAVNKETGQNQITINPELNEEKLQVAVEASRKMIVGLYLRCEQDFIKGLKIFEAIVENQIKVTDERRIENLQQSQERLLAGEDIE